MKREKYVKIKNKEAVKKTDTITIKECIIYIISGVLLFIIGSIMVEHGIYSFEFSPLIMVGGPILMIAGGVVMLIVTLIKSWFSKK